MKKAKVHKGGREGGGADVVLVLVKVIVVAEAQTTLHHTIIKCCL
jgi:hypothetical protein